MVFRLTLLAIRAIILAGLKLKNGFNWRAETIHQYRNKIMKPQIILLQTAFHARRACEEYLQSLNLVTDKDFVFISRPETLKLLLKNGERQLFITGSFLGVTEGIEEMVNKARESNPELVCMSFSIDPLPGEFDHIIPKTRNAREKEKFLEAVNGFLTGTINRAVPS